MRRLETDDAANRKSPPPFELAPLLYADAMTIGARLCTIDPWLSYPYQAEAMQKFLTSDDPCSHRRAIRVSHEMAGVVVVRANWLRGAYVHLLAVLPEWQSHGIGAAVVAVIEGEARARGDRNLWIAASDFNSGAVRLYERLGFAIVATLEDLVRDGRGEILMRKRLFEANSTT